MTIRTIVHGKAFEYATPTALTDCETLSAVIRLGVSDGRLMNEDPKFFPLASIWFVSSFRENGTACSACFAGAVMRGTLGVRPGVGQVTPDCFDPDTERKLRALEYARAGSCGLAMEAMGMNFRGVDMMFMPKPRCQSFNCRVSFERFLDSMEVIADKLEALGY